MKWIADLMKKCLPHKMEVMRVTEEELQGSFLAVSSQVVNGLGPALDKNIATDNLNLLIVCPDPPVSRLANELLHMIPSNVKVLFFESIKRSTSVELQALLIPAGVIPLVSSDLGHKVTIKVMSQNAPEPHDAIWARVEDILRRDGFAKSWEILINDERIVYDLKMAQEVEQHHNIRELTISESDITDMRILLNSTDSVDEFLAKL